MILGSVWCKVGFSVEGEGGREIWMGTLSTFKKTFKRTVCLCSNVRNFHGRRLSTRIFISLDCHDFCICYQFAFFTGIHLRRWLLSLQNIAKAFNNFHCINANKNKIHICHKITIKFNDNYTMYQSSQSFPDLFFCKHSSWTFRNPWRKIEILFSWELLIFF